MTATPLTVMFSITHFCEGAREGSTATDGSSCYGLTLRFILQPRGGCAVTHTNLKMSAHGPEGSGAASSNKRLQQTQAQVDEVVDIMRVNVDKVLERDQKLSELDDRADALQAGASQFETSAAKLKRKYWWKNCKFGLKYKTGKGGVEETMKKRRGATHMSAYEPINVEYRVRQQTGDDDCMQFIGQQGGVLRVVDLLCNVEIHVNRHRATDRPRRSDAPTGGPSNHTTYDNFHLSNHRGSRDVLIAVTLYTSAVLLSPNAVRSRTDVCGSSRMNAMNGVGMAAEEQRPLRKAPPCGRGPGWAWVSRNERIKTRDYSASEKIDS
ncbi:putative vesicle-associated membrane protein 2-like [Scophthalmus maximus]|uniref:Putative vesicle-associated membrane protein 2-like n=1 Tax=Scophthalmus maximus TaxID=52904 RepID=A0A2U9BGL7_SCOMX|nr:putative vesicle-associated membrane protein 2-like [Scophthalmus maximus]